MASYLEVIGRSNIQSGEKSAIRRWLDKASGSVAKGRIKAEAGGDALRAGGESLLVGGALGAVNCLNPKGGLDFQLPTKSGRPTEVPLDAVAGALLLAASTAAAGDSEVATDLKNAGAAAFAVFGFRKSEQYIAGKMIAQGKKDAIGFRHSSFQKGYESYVQSPIVAGEFEDYANSSQVGSEHSGFGAEGEDPILVAARGL